MPNSDMLGDWQFILDGRSVTGAVSALIGYEPCPKESTAWRAHVDMLVHLDRRVLSYVERQEISRQAALFVAQGYREHNQAHPESKVRDMYILVNVTDRSEQ